MVKFSTCNLLNSSETLYIKHKKAASQKNWNFFIGIFIGNYLFSLAIIYFWTGQMRASTYWLLKFFFLFLSIIYRWYYTVARRYGFYLRVVKIIFNEWAKRMSIVFTIHERIKFISSSHHVILFLLYRFNAKSGKWRQRYLH